MNRVMKTCVLCVGLLAACGQGPAEGELMVGLISVEIPAPEITVAEQAWRELPAGCEGIIGDDMSVEVAYAENAPALGVLLHQGVPVCVDTWGVIDIELERMFGDPSPDPMRPLPEELRELPPEPAEEPEPAR